MNKICKECFIEKELTEFYKHPQGTLGTLPRCKECICKGRRTERERKMASVSDKKRQLTEKRKKFNIQRRIKFRKKYPEKWRAQKLVWAFLRKYPEYKQKKCFVTGDIKSRIHLHHFDYTKPNEVIPCTPKVHSDFHQGKILEIKEEWILRLQF